MRLQILLIEDDMAVLGTAVGELSRAGFRVTVATDGPTGVERGLRESFDLVVLGLRGGKALEVLEGWSGRLSVPVVVLSEQADLSTRLRAFDLGAVDFMPKPVWLEELVARIRIRLGVRNHRPHRTVAWTDVVLDFDARTVSRQGQVLPLTRVEFNVLAWLVERSGLAVPRGELVRGALSAGVCSERTVDSHVLRLRRKLGSAAGEAVQTVWGVGYRFDPR